MAKQTDVELETEMGIGGQMNKIIDRRDGAATDQVLVCAGPQAPGRTRWCTITQSGNVAAQVAEITAVLVDGH